MEVYISYHLIFIMANHWLTVAYCARRSSFFCFISPIHIGSMWIRVLRSSV